MTGFVPGERIGNSEQVNKIVTLFFYMLKDNEDNIFSRAKNIVSLLRVDMNIVYKGSVSGIVHFFDT